MATDPKSAVRLSDDLFERAFPQFRQFRESRTKLLDFLAGDRYDGDTGEFNKDRRGIQIRGQEVTDTVSHVVAKVTEKPRSIEGRPTDEGTDPDLAEFMVSLVTAELSRADKGFDRENYACLTSAIEARVGCVWMDWDETCGPYGELIYGWQDVNRLLWDLPWHPHHPLCGWMMREKRIDVEVARIRYKADWLQPDNVSLGRNGQYSQGIPLIEGYTDRLAISSQRDNKITIRELYIKNDPTAKDKPVTVASEPIPVGNRYMACQSGCGFRSPTESSLANAGALDGGGELPDAMPNSCPTCAGNLMRIDARDTNQTMLAYARGRRLIVTAPFSPSPSGKPLADGNWPMSKLRSFPARFSFASVRPGSIAGPSITDKMWDQQVASDNLKTLAITRVFEHRNMWVMPGAGIVDRAGKRFEFRNDQGNVMFRDMRFAKYGPLEIQNINATGLDPEFVPVNAIIDNSLTRYRPSGDLSLTQDQSKDIAVGTAEIIQQQGEVQTNDFIRRDNQELGMFYNVVCDAIGEKYTPDRVARLNIEGADEFMRLWGDSLPGMDFEISETPTFTGLDKAKAQVFPALLQAVQQAQAIGLDPVGAIQLFAETNNLPRSQVRKFVKLIGEAQAKADAAAQAAGVPPGGDGSLPPGDGQPPGVPTEATGATAGSAPLPAAA